MKTLANIDVEKIAQAVEKDAGMPLDGLSESLQQAQHGEFAAVHTPEQIRARRGRPVGSVQAHTKVATTLRLDADVLARWRASGKGWQTKAAAILAAAAP